MATGTIVLLYFGGLVLIGTEAFMPGVVLGMTGLAMIGVSVTYGLQANLWLGIGQIVVTAAFLPFVVYVAFRQLALKRTLGAEEGVISAGEDYASLVGKTGRTLMALRPAGSVVIDHKRYDVVTEGDMIEPDVEVRVIKVEGNRIVVKRI